MIALLISTGCSSDNDATDTTTSTDVAADAGGEPVKTPVVAVTGTHAVKVGATLALSASTMDGTDTGYVWKSDDDKIATVDATGKVTGVAAGETLVSATGADTAAAGSHAVVVVAEGAVAGVPVVIVTGEYFVLTGGSITLTANTVNGTDSGYDWTSSDATIAGVDADGKVTSKAPGAVTISATGKDSMVAGAIGLMVSNVIPNYDAWRKSGHGDYTAEAFNHWNEAEDGATPVVSKSCARCHSTPGFQDYIGADGSPAEVTDADAPIGTAIECAACHNPVATNLSHVIFPSGVKIEDLGPEARCMTCHQGRESNESVHKMIADAFGEGVAIEPDTVQEGIGFKNIHYFAAGATLNAGRTRGGAQYDGKSYDWRFRHVPGRDTCVGCHDPHSLEIRLEACSECHMNEAGKVEDLKNIRMMSSMATDYDGDGDKVEGIYYEIDTLRDALLASIQQYATDKGLDAICYDSAHYPYFLIDADGDGACAADDVKYTMFTARLAMAAFNYQLSLKDPGAFAHNGKYVIQLLFDGIEDLNAGLKTPVDMTKMHRDDPGHFNGSAEPARHWDKDGVSASCSKCHSGSEGYEFYVDYGVSKAVAEPGNGLDCATCHTSFGSEFATRSVASVTFPSGKTFTPAEDAKEKLKVSMICATCHTGRESKASVDAAIAANKLSFKNVHYLPAASVLYGKDAGVGYEYDGKTYAGPFNHKPGNACLYCHDAKATQHTFQPNDIVSKCQGCHGDTVENVKQIREKSLDDYDGDGKTDETLGDELHGIADAVYAAMQKAAKDAGKPLCYNADAYPYMFADTNDNGTCDPDESKSANSFKDWTPALLKASFNYQLFQKEHGAWAHNFAYTAQLLIDSTEDLGGDISTFKRP